MFFKLNPATGRLASGTQQGVYVPQGLQANAPSQPAVFEFGEKSTKIEALPEFVKKSTSSGASGASQGRFPGSQGYRSVLSLQESWGATEGKLLVWQKRGLVDTGPKWFTLGLVVVGIVVPLAHIWNMSWPKKAE